MRFNPNLQLLLGLKGVNLFQLFYRHLSPAFSIMQISVKIGNAAISKTFLSLWKLKNSCKFQRIEGALSLESTSHRSKGFQIISVSPDFQLADTSKHHLLTTTCSERLRALDLLKTDVDQSSLCECSISWAGSAISMNAPLPEFPPCL